MKSPRISNPGKDGMRIEIPLTMVDVGPCIVPDHSVFLVGTRERAVAWAKRAGLKPPFTVTGPDRVNYPEKGHGYVVLIQEETGKRRMGTARFTSSGNESLWTVDGVMGSS